jgi:hypothetical protein
MVSVAVPKTMPVMMSAFFFHELRGAIDAEDGTGEGATTGLGCSFMVGE